MAVISFGSQLGVIGCNFATRGGPAGEWGGALFRRPLLRGWWGDFISDVVRRFQLRTGSETIMMIVIWRDCCQILVKVRSVRVVLCVALPQLRANDFFLLLSGYASGN